ncbi:MarR family winged helix-turn-helix transcriptional regulator [Paenibacillus alginolyticus]|uniref:MarR family transcriptional regulator n=1 Tax=Paenibacillus alginolyticus TaxID=59839 RepID=A0ABT4G9U4_9BACL|nr:MarR family transcriptional regulator [Paenibacillus alginolyticus]MCY9692960.1 MarR family transcriptional regulator [Paenibacillus alginolyticus]MEC0144632.1 MarR family transcriptional regulator [Paenibacillus alginolyticus]
MSFAQEEILRLKDNVQQFIRLFGILEQSVTPCGYSLSLSQVFALQELEQRTSSLNDLTAKLGLERSSVSRLIEELVKKEFVHRQLNENNRREVQLTLADKGINAIQQVRKQSIVYYQLILKDLTFEEQHSVVSGFEVFVTSLKKNKDNIL